MSRPDLTAAVIKSLEPRGHDYVEWDRLPGFGVRVRPNGHRSWLVQYRNSNGQTRRMTLSYDRLTLADARREARRLLAEVARGSDPAGDRADVRQSMRVRDVADEWIDSAELKTLKEYRRILDVEVLPTLGNVKIRALVRDDVERVQAAIAKRGHLAMADRAVVVMSSLLRYAVRRKYIDENVAERVERVASTVRDRRALTTEELQRFLAVCDELRAAAAEGSGWERFGLETPAGLRHAGRIATMFEVSLLAALRPSEACRLRWDEITYHDDGTALIHFASQKSAVAEEEARPAYLGREAVALLKSLPEIESEWCFPSPKKKGQPIADGRDVWKLISERAKLREGLAPKHLRKSSATFAWNAGTPIELISKSLRHSDVRTTQQHYASLGVPVVKQAAGRTQSGLSALRNPPAPVVELKR